MLCRKGKVKRVSVELLLEGVFGKRFPFDKEALQEKIENNEIIAVFNILKRNITDVGRLNDLSMLQNRWCFNEQKHLGGLLSDDVYHAERGRMVQALLGYVKRW